MSSPLPDGLGFVSRAIVPLTIVSFWAVMMGALVYRETFVPPLVPKPREGSPLTEPAEHWFTVQGRHGRLGQAYLVEIPVAGGTILRSVSRTRVEALGSQPLLFEGEIRLGADRRLQALDARVTGDFGTIRAGGPVVNGVLKLDVESELGRFSQAVPVGGMARFDGSLAPMSYVKDLEPGREYGVEVFDPQTLQAGWARLQVMGRERLRHGVDEVDAYVVETRRDDVRYTLWVSPAGTVLRQETPLGVALIRERVLEREDLESTRPAFSRARDLVLPADIPVSDPRALVYMDLRIRGVNLDLLDVTEEPQEILPGRDGVRIRRVSLPTEVEARSVSRSVSSEWFEATSFIDAADPEIRRVAGEIRGTSSSPPEIAGRIGAGVAKSVADGATVTVPSAREVLDERRGGPLERTVLFCALGRASGLACRPAYGLLLLPEGFRYHAWPEVHLGRWVAMDPTLGQEVADAGHVRLRSGPLDEQIHVIRLLRFLRLDILEVAGE